MTDVSRTILQIQRAVSEVGLPAFSRMSGVPYTTLVHWEKHGFRPKVLSTFEKLAAAAADHQPSQVKPRRKKAA